MKLVTSLFKEDPTQKQLKKMNLTTDILNGMVIQKSIEIFKQKSKSNQQEQFLKTLIKHLQQKGTYSKKIKIMMVLIEISKVSKYDICDIILNKKMKLFVKAGKHKHNEIQPKGDQLQNYILEELLIPLYNYLMKLSTNEQLYQTCRQGEIPYDDIFRRGTKIRFIWIFKLYNISNVIIPIIKSLLRLQELNPSLTFFHQCMKVLYDDAVIINNFVIKALQEASQDNFMLMPYFDMLQFQQSLVQQSSVGQNIEQLYSKIKKYNIEIKEPMKLKLSQQQIHEIQIQALRVKLISNSLKNPKKDHSILETQYNQKVQINDYKLRLATQPVQKVNQSQSFSHKWRNLD